MRPLALSVYSWLGFPSQYHPARSLFSSIKPMSGLIFATASSVIHFIPEGSDTTLGISDSDHLCCCFFFPLRHLISHGFLFCFVFKFEYSCNTMYKNVCIYNIMCVYRNNMISMNTMLRSCHSDSTVTCVTLCSPEVQLPSVLSSLPSGSWAPRLSQAWGGGPGVGPL